MQHMLFLTSKILVIHGQNPGISKEAAKDSRIYRLSYK